jgi:hypothetical protein
MLKSQQSCTVKICSFVVLSKMFCWDFLFPVCVHGACTRVVSYLEGKHAQHDPNYSLPVPEFIDPVFEKTSPNDRFLGLKTSVLGMFRENCVYKIGHWRNQAGLRSWLLHTCRDLWPLFPGDAPWWHTWRMRAGLKHDDWVPYLEEAGLSWSLWQHI